jgi:mannosyltransferase
LPPRRRSRRLEPSSRAPRSDRVGPLLGLCLAGGALRFATLGAQSFWLDEAATGRLVRMGLGGMLRALPGGESTPPLYYVLAWLWTRPFGTGEVGLRSLSALVGTLTIVVVYAAASRLCGRRAAVAAAALTAFSPLLIWYSQEARSYALLAALVAASVWALARALEPGGGMTAWAAVCALALATHYFAAFVIAPEAIWLLRARRRAAAPALAAVGLVAAALAPLALHQKAQGGADFIAASPLATRLAQAAKQLVVGYDAPGEVALTVAAGLLVLALAWRARADGTARRLAGVAAVAAGVPLVLAVLGLDYLITRNLIGTWVPVALVLSFGGAVSGGRIGPALVAGLCALGLAATVGIDLDSRYQRDDWRGAAATVGGRAALVVTPGSGRVPLAYYLPRSAPLAVAGTPVSVVEVVGLGARGVGAPVKAPPLAAAPPTLAGFGPAAVERRATFSVLRYTALGPPVLVTPASLAGLALDRRAPAAILLSAP